MALEQTVAVEGTARSVVRGSWDFPLVNVAAALRLEGDRITDARIVVGAVQCVPRRLTDVENLVKRAVRDA